MCWLACEQTRLTRILQMGHMRGNRVYTQMGIYREKNNKEVKIGGTWQLIRENIEIVA